MDLGTDLRIARERAGFTLQDLAARTRIPMKSLRAIEENNFAAVPPGIFVRSFIRSYAREVGVDPIAAIAEFRAMTEPVEEVPQGPATETVVDDDFPPRRFAPNLAESRPGWGYALIAAALLIGLISVNRYASDEPEATVADAAIAVDAAAEPSPAVGTSGNGVQIEMRAHAPCWVRAVVDGQVAFARLMQPGETQTLSGERDVTLRVGDPAALSYSINGRAGQPLGAPNMPVTVRFGSDGRQSRVS